jgi:predicted DNA-binding transcriptional regulator YafY
MFDGYWYALVIDNKDDKLKTFYLKGLNNIKFTDQTFEEIAQNIHDQLDSAINAHFKDKEPQTIELEIHKEIAKYFYRRPLSKKQYLRPSVHDDYEIMTIFITDFMEIIPTIQQFLPFIKVISPDYLDSIIRKNMKNYDESDLSKYFEAD